MKEKSSCTVPTLSLLVLAALAFPLQAASTAVGLPFPLIERFDNLTMKDGIPSHKVHCVLPASDGKLWVGTYKGLLVREDGRFRRISTEDGLSHPMILCLAEDPRSGDLWIGTMRGLNRYSAGRITTYTQTSSGLPNNVVYGVDVVGASLWVATAAGLGVLDLKTGTWTIYDQSNTVMHEPWVYAVKGAKDRVFVGVWGGGILEYEPASAFSRSIEIPIATSISTLCRTMGQSMTSPPGSPGTKASCGKRLIPECRAMTGCAGARGRKKNPRSCPISSILSGRAAGSHGWELTGGCP